MGKERLEDCGNLARKAGDDLYCLAWDLQERYNELCKEHEDDEEEFGDYDYECWLEHLQEVAEGLQDVGYELFAMEWKEL